MIEKDSLLSVQVVIGPKRLAQFEVFDPERDPPKGPSDLKKLFAAHSVSDVLNRLFEEVLDGNLRNPEFSGKADISPATYTNKNTDGTSTLYNAWELSFFNTTGGLAGKILICLHESNRIILGIVNCSVKDGDVVIRDLTSGSRLS